MWFRKLPDGDIKLPFWANRLGDGHVQVGLTIPELFERGSEYRMLFYNERTAYWGYLADDLQIKEEEPPQP